MSCDLIPIAAVCLVISHVPIDLSQYAEEVLKNCVPLLSSQDPDTRQDARDLVLALAKQCSDASIVLELLLLLAAALKSKL